MKQLSAFLFFIFSIISTSVFATTWDELWADKVIKEADCFVLAKVNSSDEEKGVTIQIIKTLAGDELKGQIKITNFYLLDLCSGSGHGGEFYFDDIKECYFFIKKNSKNEYCIATPTSGFDYIREGSVYATYRHSYHQALVPVETYEKTMTAIFKNYHGQSYDKEFINEFVNKQLSLKPAGFDPSEINTFFLQHVAMECAYHLRLTDLYSKLIPFLDDTANFHNQVSAARAMIVYDTPECKQTLLKVISDSKRDHFVQVICVWTLKEFKPKELKAELIKMKENTKAEDTGFGGNLMDPRICTHFPNVKEALEDLIGTL